MSPIFEHRVGDSPLLISVPHDGREIPEDIRGRMTDAGLAMPDTDWHVATLYDFATEIGANTVVANYSRYVIDLNRGADDAVLYPGQLSTGLCPLRTFADDAIYTAGDVGDEEMRSRVRNYWRPYHDHLRTRLDALREEYGYALLWDAHSIPSAVPRLFDGKLPELNLGSNNSKSCDPGIERAVTDVANASGYSTVVNGRFKGGYTTRHYGDPANNVHALQLEIAQRAYLDEQSRTVVTAKRRALCDTLRQLLNAYVVAAEG